MSNEQWKNGGDCRACRRKDYCSKPCKPYKENVDIALKELIAEKMTEVKEND